MPRGGQVARLYTLVKELAEAPRGLTVDALARRHAWRPRTVYRDLKALEEAGFPVERTEGARWKLRDGWEKRIPFPLPLSELLALHVARSLLRPFRGTPAAREFEKFFERVVGKQPKTIEGQGVLFRELKGTIAARSQLAIDYTQHEAILAVLCRAAEERKSVRAVYRSHYRGETTRRTIDPYTLYYEPTLEALYVFAWCHLRKAMRTFAVHRFQQVELTDRTFTVDPGFSVEGYLRDSFRIWREQNVVPVRLRVDPDLARWVSERKWHASQKVTWENGSAILEFEVDGTEEIRRFVLELGRSAEVLEPPFLREEIAREHYDAARRYGVPAEAVPVRTPGAPLPARQRTTATETDAATPRSQSS